MLALRVYFFFFSLFSWDGPARFPGSLILTVALAVKVSVVPFLIVPCQT